MILKLSNGFYNLDNATFFYLKNHSRDACVYFHTNNTAYLCSENVNTPDCYVEIIMLELENAMASGEALFDVAKYFPFSLEEYDLPRKMVIKYKEHLEQMYDPDGEIKEFIKYMLNKEN